MTQIVTPNTSRVLQTYTGPWPPATRLTHTHRHGQLVALFIFHGIKLTPWFPLLNCRDLYSASSGILPLPFWNSETAVCLVLGCGPEKPEQSQQKCFYWQARAARPTAPIGCNCSASQWCVWNTLCKVSGLKSARTHSIRPPPFFPPIDLREARCATGKQSPLYLSWCWSG